MSERVDLHDLLAHTRIVPVDELRPHPRNAHIGDQDLLAQSIREHGQFRAIGISSDGYVLFGNHTYFGALQEGVEEMLVHDLPWPHDHPKALAIALADNRSHRDSRDDDTLLAQLIRDIEEADNSLLEGTLYEDYEIKQLLLKLQQEDELPDPEQDPDNLPAPPVDPVTRLGDVWLLGEHRLTCGDSTQSDTYQRLMEGAEADLVFTSPPYNVDVEYASHEDERDDWASYQSFLAAVVGHCKERLADGRLLAWNIGVSPSTFPARQAVLIEDLGLSFFRQLVWRKSGTPFPLWDAQTNRAKRARQFHPNYQHEMVLLYSKGKIERGADVDFDDTLRNDVFEMPQQHTTWDLPKGKSRTGSSTLGHRATRAHPAVFPVGLPIAFIKHLADANGIVLDPFCGSGSTLIAAHACGRRGFGIELDPAYVDVACRRFQEQTGIKPVLASTGEAHDFVTPKERAA